MRILVAVQALPPKTEERPAWIFQFDGRPRNLRNIFCHVTLFASDRSVLALQRKTGLCRMIEILSVQ